MPELVAASDSVCTGLQLVNFLQDVPRDLELGRIYLPAEDRRRFGDPPLDRPSARAARNCCASRRSGRRRSSRAGDLLRARIGGRLGRAVGLFARGGLAALEALESARLGRLHPAAEAVARAPRPRGGAGARAMSAVDHAYAEVQRVTRARAKNFAYGIMVLPAAKRRAIAAVYAFAREVDDVADGELAARREARAARGAARLARRHRPPPTRCSSRSPTPARATAFRSDALSALVDGGLQDTEQTRYADFDELRGYCEKVAGAVGVACVAVYGSDDVERARTLGIALQLINIMRDVREDWELGRVYLPQDELAAFGVAEDDIAHGRLTAAWRALMAFQAAARARPSRRRACGCSTRSTAQRALRVDVRRPVPRASSTASRRTASTCSARSCRLSAPAKLAVVARGLLR